MEETNAAVNGEQKDETDERSWYVIQTLKGKEYRTLEDIRDGVAESGELVFIIENEMEYKVKGEWIKERKPFFPGYIFAEIDKERIEDFNKRLYTKNRSLKLMDVGGDISPIRPEEQEYLMALGGEEHIIYHSVGFRVDDMVEITTGSFRGYKGEIRKLDRHNRRAKICIPLMGQDIEVQIGLEIVKNITFQELEPDERIDRMNMAKIVTV